MESHAYKQSPSWVNKDLAEQEGGPQITTGITVSAGKPESRVPALVLLLTGCVTSGKPFPSLVFSFPYCTRKGLEQINSRVQAMEPRTRSETQQGPGNAYTICHWGSDATRVGDMSRTYGKQH